MRLTKRDRGGNAAVDCDNCEIKYQEGCCSKQYCRNALINKLAAYEDAEEQGLLVRLPCKVGDKVFYTTGSTVHVAKADMFKINASGLRIYCERKYAGLIGFEGIYGKTVFLTREEAEAALKGERKTDGG